MKTRFSLIFLILITSCAGNDSIIDFSNIDFPEYIAVNDSILDTLLAKEKESVKRLPNRDVKCETDKTAYHYGEKILLTIENNSSDTMHFYPNDSEGARSHYIYSTHPDKEGYKNKLVSQNPAIMGHTMYSDPAYVYLHLGGVDKFTASELGLKVFSKSLFPNEKMFFTVQMPNRHGYYQLVVTNFAHSPNGDSDWGVNQFVQSNSFQILTN